MKRAIMLGALLLCSAAANAEVVTFDGVPFGMSATPMSTYVENGVTVTSLGGSFQALSGPGELHLDPESVGFGTSAYEFTYAGGAFNLDTFDVIFAEDLFRVLLEGFDENGDPVSQLVVTDFGTVLIDGFDDLYTLRISSLGDSIFEHFSIDNLTISAPPVPEPGTWLTMLFGFGAIGYGLRCSKNRRSAALNLQS